MKFAMLASGSKGNACLIKYQDTVLLIDCGTTQKYMKQCFETLQLDLQAIDAILLTHTHGDHVAGVKLFKNHEIYGHENLKFDTHKPLQSFEEVQIKDLRVKILPVSHDSPGASGYVIEGLEHRLVYITDTGYIKEELLPYIKNADYYIFESNHDVELLMQTQRPMVVKQRILSDYGHLCNEDSAYLMSQIMGEQTKEILLAHLSEEGNTAQAALQAYHSVFQHRGIDVNKVKIRAAEQFKIIIGGNTK